MDLRGWDVASVVRLDLANKLVAGWFLPRQKLPWEDRGPQASGVPFKGTADGTTISGLYGAWQISDSGSAKFVDLAVPIVQGEMSGQVSATFSGVTIRLQAVLEFRAPAPGQQTLGFGFGHVGGSDDPTTGPLVILGVDDPNGELKDDITKTLAGMLVANAIVQQADQFAQPLAVLGDADPNAPAWLKPAASDYAFAHPGGSSNCWVVVVSRTTSQESIPAEGVVDPAMFPTSGTMALVLDPALALANVFLEALPTSMGTQGSNPGFHFIPAGTPFLGGTTPTPSIASSNSFELVSVSRWTGTYSGVATGIGVTIDGPWLDIVIDTETDLGMGYTTQITVRSKHAVQFDASQGRLVVEADPSPSIDRKLNGSTFNDYADFAAAMALAAGAFGIAAAALWEIFQAIETPVIQAIADDVQAAVTSISVSSSGIGSFVSWPDLGRIDISSAALDDTLNVAGDPAPPPPGSTIIG